VWLSPTSRIFKIRVEPNAYRVTVCLKYGMSDLCGSRKIYAEKNRPLFTDAHAMQQKQSVHAVRCTYVLAGPGISKTCACMQVCAASMYYLSIAESTSLLSAIVVVVVVVVLMYVLYRRGGIVCVKQRADVCMCASLCACMMHTLRLPTKPATDLQPAASLPPKIKSTP
jgi:hypothetical protein